MWKIEEVGPNKINDRTAQRLLTAQVRQLMDSVLVFSEVNSIAELCDGNFAA